MKKGPVTLIIMDGYGINQVNEGNAIKTAKKPNLDRLFAGYPNTVVYTSGLDVGLPDGQMGNSEVGHTNIGAGRVVYQPLVLISKMIKDGDFFKKPELLEVMEHCRKHDSKLHLYGLVSDGGVHSHIEHIYGLLQLAKRENIKEVYVHCFLDGRDVPPASAKGYIEALEENMRDIGVGKIASIMGRFYAMDRDNIWDRVKLAYDAMVMGKGVTAGSAVEALELSYNQEVYDEFVKPSVILEGGKPTATIGENDAVISFNFRPDRVREITRAFVDREFSGFEREKGYFPVYYACMTLYDKTIESVSVIYKPQDLNDVIVNNFGEYISKLGRKQLRIAETQKYAHVTYFFNGGVEQPYEGEDRILIPSPKIATFDMKPEMSAYEVTDAVIEKINSGVYDAIILNFANPDMVGHTGVMEAAVKAIEAVDTCVGRVVDAVLAMGGTALITADHGNAEQMVDYETGDPFTAHTTNVVPFVVVGYGNVKLREGRLSDIAPTMLDIMGIPQPEEMTGQSLIVSSCSQV